MIPTRVVIIIWGAPGHWTDRCYNLRHRIQDLRDQHLLEFKIETENKPNVIKNPLPKHGKEEGCEREVVVHEREVYDVPAF